MTTHATPLRQLFVVVERGTAGMRMRLVPQRNDGQQVAVANAGLGIVALETFGADDPRSLRDVFHLFRGLDLSRAAGDDDERLEIAFAAWAEALARAGLALRLERRALYGAPLPHKNWQADARGISFRPWDVELTALAAGLRAIVKLDRVPPALVESLGRTAAERGLRVEVVAPRDVSVRGPDPSNFITLLVGRESTALAHARDQEALLLRADTPAVRSAASEMGALLGYPSCCINRFSRVVEHNDTTLAWALLPGMPHQAAPAATQWLQPGLALISHSPCDLHCAASAALGERILEAIDDEDPGFAARWRAVTTRLQVVDHLGNRMAVAADGDLTTGATILAADLLASGGADPNAVASSKRLVGRTLSIEDGGLVSPDDDWHAPYVADHRPRS